MSQPFTGENGGDWPVSHFFQRGPHPGLGVGKPSFSLQDSLPTIHSQGVLGSMGAGIGRVGQVELPYLSQVKVPQSVHLVPPAKQGKSRP